MAEEKKEEKKKTSFFGGLLGNAESNMKSRKSKLEAAEAQAMGGDVKAASGEERPGYSKKWTE